MQPVEEARKYGQEIAPTPLHSTVERTAINWDQLNRNKNATQIIAVSFDAIIYENVINLVASNAKY